MSERTVPSRRYRSKRDIEQELIEYCTRELPDPPKDIPEKEQKRIHKILTALGRFLEKIL